VRGLSSEGRVGVPFASWSGEEVSRVIKPGTIVGEYRVQRKLGEGGMGEVYLAVHETLRRRVVLKGLHPQYLSDATVCERLKREAEAMARLTHPNIVALYNYLETEHGSFIVMEYVDGATFEELLHRYGPAPLGRAIELFRPVLAAIEYAHARGVIHRDLKPANIMLGSDGYVRVMDFGTAKVVDRPGLTRIGMTLGTATYMPPEQIMGEALVPATDVYAIGVTMFELVTGHLPFEGEDTLELMRRIRRDTPPAPSNYVHDLPPAFDAVMAKCLAKEPSDRYPDTKDLLAALDAIDRTLPHDAGPSYTPPPVRSSSPTLHAPEAHAAAPHARAQDQASTSAPSPAAPPRHPSPAGALAGAFLSGMGLAGTVGALALSGPATAAAAHAAGIVAASSWALGTLLLLRAALRRVEEAAAAPASAPSATASSAPAPGFGAPGGGAPTPPPAGPPQEARPRRRGNTSEVASYGWALSQPTVATRAVPSDAEVGTWRHRPYEPGSEAAAASPPPPPSEAPKGYVPAKTIVASTDDIRRAIKN